MSLAPVGNAYDVTIKPRALLAIIKGELPGDKQPFTDPSTLSRIVCTVQTHGLLLESAETEDATIADKWKSSVDEWFSRLLALASDTKPDKCWAGVCLLGASCKECSPERFLASYSIWFESILSHFQSTKSSQLIKVACFSALSDLFKRLSLYPSEKKAAVSCSDKVVQPLLKILKGEYPEALSETAAELLLVLISSFSASVNRHYESVEDVIASKLLTGNCSVNLNEMLAHCLALLPRSKGDPSYWVSTIRKALLLANNYLTEIFHGLEEESLSFDAIRSLIPPGEETPSTIWGQKMSEEVSENFKKRLKIKCVTVMMLTCSFMIRRSFPLQVPVPIVPLLNLIERVLLVDGSVLPAALPFFIASDQEFTVIELPNLHHNALDLLIAVMDGLSSHFLPHVPYIVRLMREFMKKCQLSELRIKAYSIARKLLISFGIGTAIYISQDVVENALCDLGCKLVDDVKNEKAKVPNGFGGLGKRKLDAFKTFSNPFLKKHNTKHLGEVQANSVHAALKYKDESCIQLKVVALQTLEALFTVAGAIRSDNWRPKVEQVLVEIATKCSNENWGQRSQKNTELELAALKALLSSVLSFSVSRPPHLATALDLFRRGKMKNCSPISEFCTGALFSLEALIHPRGLPLSSHSLTTNEADNITFDYDDDLYEPLAENLTNTSKKSILPSNPYPAPTSPAPETRTQLHNEVHERPPDETPINTTLSASFSPESEQIVEDAKNSPLSPIDGEKRSKGFEAFHVSKSPVNLGKDLNYESDDDLVSDFPDIVDADPDSD